jgi:nitroreductase
MVATPKQATQRGELLVASQRLELHADRMLQLGEVTSSLPVSALSAGQLLTTTRTVRKRLDLCRQVPRELIEDCARMAMQAPIACNGFYPHFVVVTETSTKTAIAHLYRRSADRFFTNSPLANLRFDDPLHDAQQPRVMSSARYLVEHLAEVPALVIPCMSPRIDSQAMSAQPALWGSVLPQTWSFMLAARANGLASAWTTLHLQFEREAADILQVDYSQVQQAAMLALAYPVGEDFKPAYRQPSDRFVHWEHW